MPDRVEYAAWDGKSNVPLCAMLDVTGLSLGSVNAGATRASNEIECSGMRRFRLHIVQLTGAGPTAVNALALAFAPNVATPWERGVLVGAMVTGTRSAFNFGEGTAILTNFMGPYVAIELVNNGGNAATYEVELWMQS